MFRLLRIIVFENRLDFISETLAVRRVAVARMFLFVNITSATALSLYTLAMCPHFPPSGRGRVTYASVVVLLVFTQRVLRNYVFGATSSILRPYARRLGQITCSTALEKSSVWGDGR